MARHKRMMANEDGWTDWVQPILKGYKLACCDCGLVHELEFDVEDGRPIFRARRDNRATGQVRRRSKK